MRRTAGIFLILIVFVLFWSCSTSNIAGGTSTTGNAKIAGSVIADTDISVSTTIITLTPSTFNPVSNGPLPDSLRDTTDAFGRYSFEGIENGIYNIQGYNPLSGTGFLHTNIIVNNDTTDDLIDTLSILGTIKLVLHDTVDIRKGFVFIQGTDIFKRIDSKVVFIDSVPKGLTPEIIYTDLTTHNLIEPTIAVNPNDTIVVAQVLYIYKDEDNRLPSSDSLFHFQLVEKGIQVIAKDESDITMADTIGMDLIIVSTSMTREKELSFLKHVSHPILIMEYYFLYEMGMTDSVKDVDYGSKKNQIKYVITNSGHPVSADLADTITFFNDSSRIDWGKPTSGADIIAAIDGKPKQAPVFCYEKGAAMIGLTAPAKRGAFCVWSGNVKLISEQGWQLFHNLVNWMFE